MNILMLTWNYPPTVGGIEQVAHYTATGLRALGHTITILAPALPPGLADPAEADGIPVLRATKKGIPRFLLHAVFAGHRCIRKNRPDLLLCPSLTSAPAAWILSRLTRVPYAVQIHGSDILLPKKIYQLAIRPLLSGARLLFANSRHTASLLEKRGLPSSRIRVVCPGVTPPPPPSATPSNALQQLVAEAEGHPVLLTVGRLVKRKGILEFIRDVLPLLAERLPDIRYWVVGGEPKASLIHQERIWTRLEDAIRAGRHETRARLLGRLTDADLDLIYRHTDLFILPCLDDPHDVEGFGIVILEAALQRVPSVATQSGGIPDAVGGPDTGLLVPPGDPHAMADAITNLLADPDRRRAMGAAARQRTLDNFTWASIAAQYADHLQTLLR